MFTYEPLVEVMKKRRKEMAGLCEELGVSEVRFRERLNAGCYLSMELLDRLCTVLKCQPGDVMDHVDGEQKRMERFRINWGLVKGAGKLSEKLRLKRNTLYVCKCRDSKLDMDTIRRLAKELGVATEDLIRKEPADSAFKDFVDGVTEQKEPVGDDFPATYDDDIEPVVRRESGPSVDKTLEKLGLTKGLATPASPEDSKRIGQKFIDEYLEGKK